MNKRIFWTAAALLTAALGTPLASHAQQNSEQPTSPQLQPAQPVDTIKVGEYQSTTGTKTDDAVIARIQTRTVAASHQVATLYVRNIPVLTFVGHSSVATNGKKFGSIRAKGEGVGNELEFDSSTLNARPHSAAESNDLAEVATIGKLPTLGRQVSVETDDAQSSDPVWRASLVAAKLNQLSRDNLDASKITAKWQAGDKTQTPKSDSGRYLIAVNGEELVEINAETQLADTTKDRAKDALQATNRLRRLLGNAPPLREIAGKPLPKPPKQIALGPIRISLSGWASWYGPEFQGNLSASGEVFNQNDLTAAHRTLPFGTQVRVTNMNNGRSVVVRINDRGPYIQGRIIDLSTAAARVLGLMETGVAPVRLDVLR